MLETLCFHVVLLHLGVKDRLGRRLGRRRLAGRSGRPGPGSARTRGVFFPTGSVFYTGSKKHVHVPPTTSALQMHLCPLPIALGAVYFALCTLYFVLVHFACWPEGDLQGFCIVENLPNRRITP